MEGFLFWVCGLLMVLGAIMTVAQRSAVVSAVWLIFTLICGSGIFALLNAPFLAVLQVLVYAGAIMVLFIFVIMMLQGPELKGDLRGLKLSHWPAVGIAPLAVIAIVVARLRSHGLTPFASAAPAEFGSPTAVAELLLGKYLMAFEVISVVLLVALIGALALGRDERKLPWR